MALHPGATFSNGHLRGWVWDAELELIRFTCIMCGATTEPFVVGQPVPDTFHGIDHDPDCPVLTRWKAAA